MRVATAGPLLVAGTLVTGCATSGIHVPQPFPRPGLSPDRGVAETAPADPYAITTTALSLRGVPYVDGGMTPRGFDCSGFTHYVFGQHGVELPRLAAEQFRVGADVEPNRLEPGDLVFFTTITPGPSHVGLVIGGDEFVHAPSDDGEVRVERLSSRYWTRRYLGARRVVEN